MKTIDSDTYPDACDLTDHERHVRRQAAGLEHSLSLDEMGPALVRLAGYGLIGWTVDGYRLTPAGRRLAEGETK